MSDNEESAGTSERKAKFYLSEFPDVTGSVVMDGLRTKEASRYLEAQEVAQRDPTPPSPVHFFPGTPEIKSYALSAEAETYELEKYKMNILCIFNHVKIDAFEEERLGTDKDVKVLVDTFSRFGFTLPVDKPYTDYTDVEIESALTDLVDTDLSDVGCIIVAVLSHGGDNGMIYAKNKQYHESKLFDIFQNSKNKTLCGKPVLFIIQACRVENVSPLKMDAKVMRTYTLPDESDVMILHSTYQGTPSMRHTEEGSWFIQELCAKVNKYFMEDFLSITTRVARQIAVDKEYKLGKTLLKQMVTCTTTLTRKLFLKEIASSSEGSYTQMDRISDDEISNNNDAIATDGGHQSIPVQKTESRRSKLSMLNIAPKNKNRRSFSTGDTLGVGNRSDCPRCVNLQTYNRSYFEYIFKLFVKHTAEFQYGETNIIIAWEKHLDRTDVNQMRAITAQIVEFLNKNATEWVGYPFVYLQH